MLERQLYYKADLERAMLQKGFKVFEPDASLHNLDDMMQLASPHMTQRYLGQDPSTCGVFHRYRNQRPLFYMVRVLALPVRLHSRREAFP
jgi:hypothetical protein